MKKNIFLILSVLLLHGSTLLAQIVEGTACTASCLDPNKSSVKGRMPNANGISPNQNLPCGAGTTEDNPAWWIVRASGNSLTFQINATNCVGGGLGVQLNLWEGDACASITSINCIVGTGGVLTIPTTPCKLYYLQLDGLMESVCDITLTYDKNQLLTMVDKPKITGPSQVCKGGNIDLCASIATMQGCTPNSWKWTVEPASAGTITTSVGSDCATLKLTGTIPANGKVKVCAEPIFKGKCPPTTQKECKEIDVLELKPATCNLTLCPESRPIVYELIKCIKTTNPNIISTVTPETFIIDDKFAPGTSKTQSITYTVDGCQGQVNLGIKVLQETIIKLPPVTLCHTEKKIVKGEEISCSNASSKSLKFKSETSEADKELGRCDTTFELLVSCSPYAGVMQNKLLITSNNINKSIVAKHQKGTEVLGADDSYIYILHEGNSAKIVNQIASNKTGVFKFDATKMKCNKIYYVSYVVGASLNGTPNLADKCTHITPKGQAIVWLCPIKPPTAAAREDNQAIVLSENTVTEVMIYPNPTDDKFFVALPTLKNTPSLDLFDMQGKKVLSQNDITQYDDTHYEVQVSDLPKGVYLLKMNLDGKSVVEKIVVE